MGWSEPFNQDFKNFTEYATKHLIPSSDYELLKRRIVKESSNSAVAYSLLINMESGEKIIGVDLINRFCKKGDFTYMHKAMDETVGPHVYSCPISFLKASTTKIGYSEQWRAQCLYEHEKKQQLSKLKYGAPLESVYGDKLEFRGKLGKKYVCKVKQTLSENSPLIVDSLYRFRSSDIKLID